MQIEEYLDISELTRHIDEGIVDRRRHKVLPLSILCYSRRATFENIWNDITEKCRGLIVDDNGLIVARSFPKFFNLETQDRPETYFENLPKEAPEGYEKLDGSLGIRWKYNGTEGVASKGSFHSDHAYWATYWYSRHCKNAQWPDGCTPVFEMICQSVQRHVVYYEIEDQLMLLALINNETGEELPYNDLYHYAFINGVKVVDIFHKGSAANYAAEDRENKEGYVLSWKRPGQSPLKVKIKHETFLKLQKIVHSATPKAILEAYMNKEYELIRSWEESASPELGAFVKEWSGKFTEMYGRLLLEAKKIVDSADMMFDNRKDVATYFLNDENKEYSGLLFAMYYSRDPNKNTDYTKYAWKLVEKQYEEELNRPVMGDPDDDLDEIPRHDGNPNSYHPNYKGVA